MAIDRDLVIHVAKLAQLELSEPEIGGMVRDLGRILSYFEELSSVDTTGVPPLGAIAVASAPFRKDAALPGTDRELALAEAARTGDGCFAVPAFVDEA